MADDRLKWSAQMEAAYDRAMEQLGGPDAAKPKALHELLHPQFPFLTMAQCKWKLQSHRRRAAREQEHGPSTEVQLEEAYEAAVARLGGIWDAKPKDIHSALAAEFPELNVQHCKWHLYSQRRAAERRRQRQQGESPAPAASAQQQQQQQPSGAGSRHGHKRRQDGGLAAHAASQLPAPSSTSGSLKREPSPPLPCPSSTTSLHSLQAPTLRQQLQQQQELQMQQQHQQQQHQQPPRPELRQASPVTATAVQLLEGLKPAGAAPAAQLPVPHTAALAQLAALPSVQPIWPLPHRQQATPQAPWAGFVEAAAVMALMQGRRKVQYVRRVISELEVQARELVAVVAALEGADSGEPGVQQALASLGGPAAAPLDAAAAAAAAGMGTLPAAMQRALATAVSAQPQHSITAGAAVGRLLGQPAAATNSSSIGVAGALGGAPTYQRKSHDPATCTAPGCRLCAYDRRLRQQQSARQQQQPPQQQQPAPALQQAPQLPSLSAEALLANGSSDAMAALLAEADHAWLNNSLTAMVGSGGSSGQLLDALLQGLSGPQASPPPDPHAAS